MIPDPRETPVLTVEQTAAILKVGRSATYAAITRGEIPVVKIGRMLRVPTAALLRILGIKDGVSATNGDSDDDVQDPSREQHTASD